MEWYKKVPKDRIENLRFRKFLLEKAAKNRDLQLSLMEACRLDILFFINAFVYQYNPNSIGTGSPEIGPFITWDFQDHFFKELEDAVEQRMDAAIEKSREMGASWGCILFFLKMMLFDRNKKLLMVSRNEAMVDSSDDPDSLFWKLDFVIAHLPTWMTRRLRRRKLIYTNPRTNSSITGQATTGKAGVGGRATAIFLDEFALLPDAKEIWQRTAGTSNSRIINSTHDGPETVFAEIINDARASKYIKLIQMHWTQHPDKCRGLYRYDTTKKKVIILDKKYKFPRDYEFDTTGKPTGGPHPGVRSVWYDQKCAIMRDPRSIAIDLDIDAKGSVSQYFDSTQLMELIRDHCRDPIWEGLVEYDQSGRNGSLVPAPHGPLKVWCMLPNGRPQPSTYMFGCDISQGVGTSPSCVACIDAKTRELVFELVTNDVRPEVFARIVSSLGWLFKSESGIGATVAWEANGPGGVFGRVLMQECGYENVFYRKTVQELNRGKMSEAPGWYSTGVTKANLLGSYRAALASGDLINRSAESMSECLSFRYDKKSGVPVHGSETSDDPTVTKINHGDRVIAAALAWMLAREVAVEIASEERKEKMVPVGSLAWRRMLEQDRVSRQNRDTLWR